MSDSKEVSKTVITSRALVLRPEKNSGNNKAKEGILLVCLALVIMAFAYLFYSGGFGGGSFGNANEDGICQSTENCADNSGDCVCAAGKECSLNDKICVDSNVPAGLVDNSSILPAAADDSLPVPAGVDDVLAEALPASVTLSACRYDNLTGLITCDTNCQSDPNGNTTLGVTDSNGTLAIARQSAIPIKIGNVSFSPGKVEFQALHVEVMGGVISYSFSELNQDISQWKVFISCNNPPGSASLSEAIKLQ
jgi:hypothetical protein